MNTLNITSETGRLRRVIVHSPGHEVEAMRPSKAEEDLYNDIIHVDVVRKEHAELKGFLGKVAEVYEVSELLEQSLLSPYARTTFSTILTNHYDAHHRIEELSAMDAPTLAKTAINGLPARNISLTNFLSDKEYDLKPLPNMYFMRDAVKVYRNKSIASAMRYAVRTPEALINRFIFENHPDFKGNGCLLDGPSMANDTFATEGGDFQVIAKNVLAIGISQRTSAAAVDAIAAAVTASWHEGVTIFAVELPIARATIHLDMVFTVIDQDACLVFEPVILGPKRSRVIRIDAEPGRETRLTEVPSLIEGLKAIGIDLKPVCTGGTSIIHAEREQWLSGANSFSFAPGKILMYACNVHTADAFVKEGFTFKHAKDFLQGNEDPMSYGRLVVGFEGAELARGGGGARCMTCPVKRDDL